MLNMNRVNYFYSGLRNLALAAVLTGLLFIGELIFKSPQKAGYA